MTTDMMTVANFIPLPEQKPILQPCRVWYDEDKTIDIYDADGFHRENEHACVFWNFVPVPKKYYENRRDRCSIISFGQGGHRQPFDIRPGDQQIWEDFKRHPLSRMVFTVIGEFK